MYDEIRECLITECKVQMFIDVVAMLLIIAITVVATFIVPSYFWWMFTSFLLWCGIYNLRYHATKILKLQEHVDCE